IAHQLAHALAGLLDDAPLRDAAVAALRDGGAERREVGLMALLGRGEANAVALASSSFVGDPPAARATAAWLLNNLPDGGERSLSAEVLDAARAALADPAAGERVREEATGLLGRPGASDADLALLERC